MEIELYSKLQNAADMEKVATMLGKSGIFGNDRLEFGMAVLLTCASERITPIQFARTYHIIQGKVQKKSMAAHAEFRAKGAKIRWIKNGDDGQEAKAEIEFEGVKSEHSFTIEQAKRQQLVKPNSNWEKTPGNMLRSRLLSNAIGMLCPEIYTGDEADDPMPEHVPLLGENVIDVPSSQVVAPTIPPEGGSTPPPEPPTKTEPCYTVNDIAISLETQRLTVRAMAALESVIGEANRPAAILWLKAKGWIKDTMSELSVDRARRIFQKPAEFLKYINAKTGEGK